MMEKPHAHIEDWSYTGHTLVGRISKHPNQSNFRSELQRTSEVIFFDPSNKIAETENTIYTLGTRFG